MCELVWGELDTFVKKTSHGFGENTPFTGERPAKLRARPDIDGDDGPRSRPPYTYTTRPSARVMCVPNMVSKSMSVRGAIPYSVLTRYWRTLHGTHGFTRRDTVAGGSLQWLPARVMSVLPRWHTQRCGRCQNSRYLHGQTRVLPLSSSTCSARTSPSTILRHRPPVTRS